MDDILNVSMSSRPTLVTWILVLVLHEDKGYVELLLPLSTITIHNVPTCVDQHGSCGER